MTRFKTFFRTFFKAFRNALSRVRSRLPKLAPAEKFALLAIISVLAAGGLLRAWERSGMTLGPVDDWESLRDLVTRSRNDFAKLGGGKNGGGYPCAIDALPGFSAGASSGPSSGPSSRLDGEGGHLLAAGMGFKSKAKSGGGGGGGGSGGKKAPPARPLDLNAASEKALLSLPGVGPSTAKAILAHRAAHGPFRSVDDLLQVKGIGPKKLDALRPYARVATQTGPSISADSTPPP